MGFEIETVEGCPVTKGSEGVITFTPEQIAMVAGAVRDKIEWMVLLHGERSADGYEVRVDRFTVPPQYRSGAEVELAEEIALPEDCVGVMHSHHHMGAFFSHTDDTELNPRFPSSIVVATANNNLGFAYRACGKVALPCGALGLVDFELAIVGNERFAAEPIKGQHGDLAKDGKDALKGCTRRYYADHPTDSYLAVDQTQCGLTIGAVVEKPLMFGMDGSPLLAAVQSMTRERVDRRLPAYYQGGVGNSNQTYTRVNDELRKGKKRKGKGGKLSARRNGLVKLERPGESVDPPQKPYTVVSRCDDCGFKDNLYFHSETSDWLCAECWREVTEVPEDQSSDDRTVIVTDQIEMGEDSEVFGGWGI
jgi:hypothetical protein